MPQYDIFISHASKDKEAYVEKLKLGIEAAEITVFYDEDSIAWGDCIKERIDEALANCKYAVVVISKNYFGRSWTEYELKMLLERQNQENSKIILPILHKVSKRNFVKHYPKLENIKFLYSKSCKISEIVEKIQMKLNCNNK